MGTRCEPLHRVPGPVGPQPVVVKTATVRAGTLNVPVEAA